MFKTKKDFIAYLKETLIPDLRTGKFNHTADDFEEAIYWMNKDEITDIKGLIQKSDTGFSTEGIGKILLREGENEHTDRNGVG